MLVHGNHSSEGVKLRLQKNRLKIKEGVCEKMVTHTKKGNRKTNYRVGCRNTTV
jgi:hypothetical protein